MLAFCKRLLICSTHSTPPIAAGLIFLVSEVCRSRPTLIEKLISTLELCPESENSSVTENTKEDSYFLLGNFDGSKRNPTYACQNASNSWELVLFKSHFNPSVQSFAKSFMDPTAQHTITYSGDPTIDFSITSFLNRFAYKNPKKQQVEQRRKRSQVLSEEPINTSALETNSEVAPEKVFFYKFFGERDRLIAEGKSRKKKRRNEDDEDEDRSDLGSDFDETEIDRFADKLADELMENYAAGAGNPDIDDDEDNFDEEDFEGGSQDDSDTPHLDDDEAVDSDNEVDFDEDEDEDIDVHHAPGKKKKIAAVEIKDKKRKKDSDIFAAAEDFEDDMEANLVGVTENESNVHELKSKKSNKRIRKG